MRLIACLLALLLAGAAAAESCGGVGAPCLMPDGREYHALTPEGAAAAPAVVFRHGWGGRGEGIVANTGLAGAILGRGYALIAPQGTPRREGDTGGAWNSTKRADRADDLAFLAAVAADAAARFGLDRDRMLLAGFSGGGMMAWRVACDAPESFAAYAPIAGLMWRPLPGACAGPVRLQHTHGWSDKVVPLEGRTVGGGALTQGDLFRGLALMRAANGCLRDDPDEYAADGPYLIRRWTACAPGAALEMALHPAGHRIPAGWTALALDWFEGRPAPARN